MDSDKLCRLRLFLFVGVATIGMACRSKLDVKTESGGAKPVEVKPPDQPPPVDPSPPALPNGPDPEPPGIQRVEIANAIGFRNNKRFFQSREVITMEIANSVLEGANHWQLLNMDMDAAGDESKSALVMEGDIPDAGAELLDMQFALLNAADRMVLAIFPSSDARKAINFGENMLRFVTDNGNWTEVALSLKDFDLQGVSIVSFSGGAPIARTAEGYEFQGWVSVVGTAVAKAEDGTSVTHGMFDMMNPR